MVLNPLIHSLVLANHDMGGNYLLNAWNQLKPQYASRRNVMALDRNSLILVIYGRDDSGTRMEIARSQPRLNRGSGPAQVSNSGEAWSTAFDITSGEYCTPNNSVMANVSGVATPLIQRPPSGGSYFIDQWPSFFVPVSTPDSTQFDTWNLWYGTEVYIGYYLPWHGLRNMPFNTAGLRLVVQVDNIVPTEFELIQPGFVAFDLNYYNTFSAVEANSVVHGPYHTVDNAVVYGGNIGIKGSGNELVFDNLNWKTGAVIAAAEIRFRHKPWLTRVEFL